MMGIYTKSSHLVTYTKTEKKLLINKSHISKPDAPKSLSNSTKESTDLRDTREIQALKTLISLIDEQLFPLGFGF